MSNQPDRSPPDPLTPESPKPRRAFLKAAGVLTLGAATVPAAACRMEDQSAQRRTDAAGGANREQGFDRSLLDAVAAAVLPESLGSDGIRRATDAFVAWSDGYDPVAEEMHGYGYAEIRYLPADPAPAWRAQLAALDTLALRMTGRAFPALELVGRRDVLAEAMRGERGESLPAPLMARHVATALLAHWAAQPAAWNLALGVQVNPSVCRTLADAPRKPLPVVGGTAS
jgi:hypothetical protein